ncbi:MAG: methyltransferase domain-containing protein [Kiritimatiellales bacterium]|nr:methyltransferase domain-containing protein [Kiritimatiellales bacterium]
MDDRTQQVYLKKTGDYVQRYDAVVGGISEHFTEAFPKGAKVLDIGCGSGRDLRVLHEMGYQADGVDPCPEFVEHAKTRCSQYGSTIEVDSLPGLSTLGDAAYDGILCSAVLMHLPEEELFDSVFTLRRILREKGRLLISIPLPDDSIDPCTLRDDQGRLFNGISPGQLELLLERIGFKLINRNESEDGLQRAHRRWATLLFRLERQTGSRPIDTIESVLNKDNKVATYKLALFRTLAEIAVTNYKVVEWEQDGRVKVPISSLAEKWIEYYWPIIESEKYIPQTRGKAIAFRKQMKALVDFYRGRGGLSAYTLDYRNRALSVDAKKLSSQLLSKLKNTIKVGPVKHAGGSSNPVFEYSTVDKAVLIGSDIWKELSLMGTWIQDATVLRWAELTAKISKGEIKPSMVIECLLTSPVAERDVGAARTFYDNLKNKVCVWSDKPIENSFDLDHAIPFSLWKNNDLWNLLPTDSAVNGQKKDRLPSRELVRRRKTCVVDYWTKISEEFPARFEYEAQKFMGASVDRSNWENRLFSTFAEAVEVTAVQRGVARWDLPSDFAVGTSTVCEIDVRMGAKQDRQDDGDTYRRHPACPAEKTDPKIIEFPALEERFITCIPFYPYAATAGKFDLDQYIEDEHAEWIAVDDIRITQDFFAMRITGCSMEPKISDGDICIFRRGSALAGSRNGRIMLVKHRDINGADSNGQFTVKRYQSERVYGEDGVPLHVNITLCPINPDYEPIVIEHVEDENEFRVIAEFVCTL